MSLITSALAKQNKIDIGVEYFFKLSLAYDLISNYNFYIENFTSLN